MVPIFGYPTPFHISTLKNLSSSVEGEFTYLRLNFFHPGVTINKAAGTNATAGTSDAANSNNPDSIYIKEM